MKFSLYILPCLCLALPGWVRADLSSGKNQGAFVTTLTRQGDELWSGTEDQGVGHFNAGKWTYYTTRDGLGDDSAYALATDRLGRVWVGHLNHGVSVWNGKTWRNYGVTTGPLGERVFAIAVSPVDGDVWIAHNAGLTRYSIKNDTWTHYTRTTGLPTEEFSCLTFDAQGRLWGGTQHDGLVVGTPKDDFKSWRQIKGKTTLPLVSEGKGLPSNWINDVLITPESTIYVATNTGLAQSDDHGQSWTFLRGRDWQEKARGSQSSPSVSSPAEDKSKNLLSEDYVTDLEWDERGLLCIGYRHAGYEVRQSLSGPSTLVSHGNDDRNSAYVSSMVPLEGGAMALGFYGKGVQKITPPLLMSINPKSAASPHHSAVSASAHKIDVPFPTVAGGPSANELKRLLQLIRNRPVAPKDSPPLTVLPADWTTQGDWRGRYGRYWALLGAMLAPRNYTWGVGKEIIYYDVNTGSASTQSDKLRYRVDALYTDDRRVLEMPTVYFDSRLTKGLVLSSGKPAEQNNRRQSEWNDQGEAYPTAQDGLFVTLSIPKGDYILSFYNCNRDAHDDLNRDRDYKISVRPHDFNKSLSDSTGFNQAPEWAQSRQRDFWGGEWKKYAVRGPKELTINVGRNDSRSTVLSGLFLDEISEEPQPYFDAPPIDTRFKVVEWEADNANAEDLAAEQVWNALNRAQADDALWWASQSRIFYQALLRHYQTGQEPVSMKKMEFLSNRIGTCYYQLNLYPQWEQMQEKRGLKTARLTETALKWDGKSNFDGHGRVTVTAYRSGQSVTQAILDEISGCACHSAE